MGSDALTAANFYPDAADTNNTRRRRRRSREKDGCVYTKHSTIIGFAQAFKEIDRQTDIADNEREISIQGSEELR